jgi:hypothetical protein
MNNHKKTNHQCFRFRTGKGQWLTDEIARIEEMATKRIQDGVSHHSVQTGARALLNMLLVASDSVTLLPESPIPACTPPSEPPRCAAPEK